jgi:hypothetical protein
LISRGFPKRLSVCSKSLRNAKDQNTPFQTKGPKRAVETPERQGTQLCTFRFGRSGNGTRVQLWISYMHIVREPETAPGSNYGFSVCILCESRKRHQGPIMDFLYAYCARVINRIWDLETVNHVSSCDGQAWRRKAILD